MFGPLYGTIGPLGRAFAVAAEALSSLLNGLVSYWPLDEQSGTRMDVVGTNHLTDNNTVGAVNRGPAGTVASFVAANSEWLQGGAAVDTSGDCTIAIWAKPTDLADGYARLFLLNGAGGDAGLGVEVKASGAILYNNRTYGITPITLETTVDRWILYLFEYVKATTTSRVMAVGSSANSGVWSAGNIFDLPVVTDVTINGVKNSGQYAATMKTGPAAIWSRVLTAGEINALFASGNGKRYADLTAGEKTDLVSYWNLDEVAGARLDSHGINHLTDNNTVGSVNSGPLGVVAKFAGAPEYLSASLTAPANPSMTVWFKASAAGIQGIIQLGTGAYGQPAPLLAYLNGTTLTVEVYSNAYVAVQTYALSSGSWNMLYLQYNGTTKIVKASLNGETITATAAQANTVAATEISIGSLAANFYCTSLIGLAGLWSQALAQAEITSLFNSGNGKKYADLTTAEKVDLVSYWNLDEASGTRSDSHGTNHLTDNNTVGSVINAGGAMDGAAASFLKTSSEDLSCTSVIDTSSDFTVSFWIKITAGAYCVPIRQGASASNLPGIMIETPGNLYPNQGYAVSVGIGDNTNRWILCIYEYTASTTTSRAMLLGSILNDGTWTPDYVQALTQGVTLHVGGGGAYAGDYVTGQMDEVAIWSRVLTSDERAALFNAGRGFYYPYPLA